MRVPGVLGGFSSQTAEAEIALKREDCAEMPLNVI